MTQFRRDDLVTHPDFTHERHERHLGDRPWAYQDYPIPGIVTHTYSRGYAVVQFGGVGVRVLPFDELTFVGVLRIPD